MNAPTHPQRILGGLYGSLVGDALGVPVEFKPRADRVADPVTDMRDYGTHGQPAGTWSDDGALLLCSVESLVEKGFDTEDMGARFVRWCSLGHWTAHGTVFDIGIATRKALRLIEQGCPAELAGGRDPYDNGNGSLMRILPVTLAFYPKDESLFRSHLERASAITHGHARSKMACTFYGLMVRALMHGLDPQAALHQAQACFAGIYERSGEFSHFITVMQPTLGTLPESRIGSGGYVMETLTAALWCLLTTSSFSECVLKAVNLGDDTDTTGCVVGGLAGVYYGLEAIPEDWRAKLPRRQSLHDLFQPFISLCSP
ncbi:MAG: ADP-ribosylglycohydrolase family protein [Verrucomicrobiota bacterium]